MSEPRTVGGELTFQTVPGLYRESAGWFAGEGELVIDLAAVTRADSAGLALLVEWLKRARPIARFLLQFARRAGGERFTGVERAGGDFIHGFLNGVPVLLNKDNLILRNKRDDGGRTGVFDHLPHGFPPVIQNNFIFSYRYFFTRVNNHIDSF